MSVSLLWVLSATVVDLAVSYVQPKTVGHGRLLSRPLWRYRFFAPGYSPSGVTRGFRTRRRQTDVVFAVCIPASFVTGWGGVAYGASLLALILDDLLTGDDDRWKRFKDRARNAIRWRMTLPAPAQT